MALRDHQLIEWLSSDQVAIRTAALELLSNGYSTDHRWCYGLFSAWDRFTPQEAFPEFPLITHLELSKDVIPEVLHRVRSMSIGKSLTDRSCRCGGKLLEAISVSSPFLYLDHFAEISDLKKSSKIFFRIDLDRMQFRAEQLTTDRDDPLDDWFHRDVEPTLPYGYYPHLEASFLKGQADSALRIAFEQLKRGDRKPHVMEAALELSTRYRLVGYEAAFADGIDDENSSIADACAIALSRCRNDNVLSLIADRFPEYSRSGQLRSIDVLRRSRLPKTSELLKFLRAHSLGAVVQNALRIAEIMQFDFSDLENWLEAVLLVDDTSLRRVLPSLCLAGLLSDQLEEQDRLRALHLIRTRVQS